MRPLNKAAFKHGPLFQCYQVTCPHFGYPARYARSSTLQRIQTSGLKERWKTHDWLVVEPTHLKKYASLKLGIKIHPQVTN